MSDARKCDNCNKLFEAVFGCVTIDISVKEKRRGETYHSWSDVDFCPACSSCLLDLIGPALHGLYRPSPEKKTRVRLKKETR